MNYNEKKKLTWIDTWSVFYTDKARMRTKREEKRRNARLMRKINKEIIRKEVKFYGSL